MSESNLPDLQLDCFVFADGQVWNKGSIFYRDPNNPNRFVLNKHGSEATTFLI